MLLTFILKEVRQNLLSSRFVIGFLFVLVVYITGTFVICDKYQTRLQQYLGTQKSDQAALESGRRGLQNLYKQYFQLLKDPKLTSFIASSTESRIPRHSIIKAQSVLNERILGGMGFTRVRTNYVLDSYSELDLVFIVGIVMSFLAIVLSYDAISRDREAGTLKQQLSNAVPRAHILLGKYLAMLILLLIPALVGSLLSIIIVLMLLGQNMLLTIPIEILLSCVMAVIYLSIFLWLGLWISSSVSKSATSLALLLLIWISVVVLFPYVGGMIALRFHPIPSMHQAAEQFRSLDESLPIPKEMNDFLQGKEKGWGPLQKYYDEAESIDKKLLVHRFTELMDQATAAESFNFYSPYSAFRQAVEDIANTGLRYHSRFYHAVEQYRDELVSFIRERDRLDPLSKHRICSDERFVSLSHRPVEPEMIPKFAPQRAKLAMTDVQTTLPALGYLVAWNVAMFFMAMASFSKSDVR